jgi:hypothetical protein
MLLAEELLDLADPAEPSKYELQPDFKEQKSLVQEVIEAAGHLCIFLPKFHCELNFIEFFWGVVKKYLRDNCDYTFATLKENMPKAQESVRLSTIRLWEHRMYRWMEATWHSGCTAAGLEFQFCKVQITPTHPRDSCVGFRLSMDSTCRGTPNWTSSKYISPSILIVNKFRLEVLFVSLKGVFLLEEKKLGLNLNVRNCLHKIGGV